MNKYSISFLSLVLFGFLSCTSSDKIKSLDVDIAKNDSVSIKTFFKKMELTPLETNTACLLNNIVKLAVVNGDYLVLDKKQEAVFIFNSSGKYVKTLILEGRNAQAISRVADFEFNPFTGELEVLSRGGIIYKYSREKYNYMGSTALRLGGIRAVQYFKPISKDVIALYSLLENKRVSFYSRQKNKVYLTEHPIPLYIARKTPLNDSNSPFEIVNGNRDSVILHEVFSNNVYLVTADGLKLRYMWDFGKYNLDLENLLPDGRNRSFYKQELQKDSLHAFNLKTCIENTDFIYASAAYGRSRKFFIYNKKKKTAEVFNHFMGKDFIPYHNLHSFTGGVYSFVNPSAKPYLLRSSLLEDASRGILSTLPPNANPVIVKYFFR